MNNEILLSFHSFLMIDSTNLVFDTLWYFVISFQDLLKTVRPTNLLPPDVILDAIQSKNDSRDMELKYRGYLSKIAFKIKLFGKKGDVSYLLRAVISYS